MGDDRRSVVGGLAASETAGALGLQVVYFLVPLAAIQMFEAGPLAIGALNLLDSVAALAFGLAAGHWIDRVGGIRAIATANGVRFGVLALLGVALVVQPQMWMLYAAMLCIGVASLTHEAGLTTAVLQLGPLSAHRLNRVNALMRGSSVVSELAGPGIGGVLVAAVGFGTGAVLGSVGFALAAIAGLFCLRAARVALPSPTPPGSDSGEPVSTAPRGQAVADLTGGLRFIWRDRTLRNLSLSSCQFNLFSAVFQTVFLIYCVRELRLDTAAIAIVAVTAGVGALVGTAIASSAVVATHQKSFYVCSLAVPALCVGAMMLAIDTSGIVPLVIVSVAQAVFSGCMVVCIVLFNTIRQLKSPAHMAGQIAASERVLALAGEIPGALLGGVLGTAFVLSLPLGVAAVGMVGAGLWLWSVPDWSTSTQEREPSVTGTR